MVKLFGSTATSPALSLIQTVPVVGDGAMPTIKPPPSVRRGSCAITLTGGLMVAGSSTANPSAVPTQRRPPMNISVRIESVGAPFSVVQTGAK